MSDTNWKGLSAHGVAMKAIEEKNPELVVSYITQLLQEERDFVCEVIEKYQIFTPTCGYESEEEKGFQKGFTAGEKLMQRNLLEKFSLPQKEVGN